MSAALALAPGQATVWLSVGQAARRLGVSRTVVRRLISEGRLTACYVSHWPRVPAAEVDALAVAHTLPAVRR